MLNINRFLENSKRSDIRGYNIYTAGVSEFMRDGKVCVEKWDKPSLGLNGAVAIGHQLDIKDILIPKITVNYIERTFEPVRNYWTPAFMETYYRSSPVGEYLKSGLVAVKETKCFAENDVFISEITIFNDDKEVIEFSLELATPFEEIAQNSFSVMADIIPRSLGKKMKLKGFAAIKATVELFAKIKIPANSKFSFKYGLAFSANDSSEAEEMLDKAFSNSDVFTDAENRFNNWMEKHIPRLRTPNTDMLKVYYYRAFVIKTSIHNPSLVLKDSNFENECVYESPFGPWFGAPIGLPVPLHIEEMKWLKDTRVLNSNINNWCLSRGNMQDYNQFVPMAILDYYKQTKDKSIIHKCYDAIKKYTLKKVDAANGGLPITKEGTKGTEYKPSFYQYTEPEWDWRHDNESGMERRQIYRVDACTMYIANLFACKEMASISNLEEDKILFSNFFEKACQLFIKLCWNEEKQFFFDVDVNTGKQCDKAYCFDGFMPMMWQLFGEKFNSVFLKLEKNKCFDGNFAITSVDKDSPMYWFDNCITGPTVSSKLEPHEYRCCWNGPIWPYAMTLILTALGDSARDSVELQTDWSRLFKGYTELHFDNGDRSVPVIGEHYRPTDGVSLSPYTEYFHSEWINLFMSYWAGINITKDNIVFSPFTKDDFLLENVAIGGKVYTFSQLGEKCNFFIDNN